MSILTLFKGLKHPAPAPWGPVRKGGAMNLLEAVWVRRSQRTYLPRPLEEVQRETSLTTAEGWGLEKPVY